MTLAPAFIAMLDGRHGSRDARIGRNLAVLDRNVQVGADEDTLALEIKVGHADELGHIATPEKYKR